MTSETDNPVFDSNFRPPMILRSRAGDVWRRLPGRPKRGPFKTEQEYVYRDVWQCAVGYLMDGTPLLCLSCEGPQHVYAEFWYERDDREA